MRNVNIYAVNDTPRVLIGRGLVRRRAIHRIRINSIELSWSISMTDDKVHAVTHKSDTELHINIFNGTISYINKSINNQPHGIQFMYHHDGTYMIVLYKEGTLILSMDIAVTMTI